MQWELLNASTQKTVIVENLSCVESARLPADFLLMTYNEERISCDLHSHVEVHERLIKFGSSARSDAMAQADLTPTDLLGHLRHLHPASLCPCERTVSSAWLQPLCGGAITG